MKLFALIELEGNHYEWADQQGAVEQGPTFKDYLAHLGNLYGLSRDLDRLRIDESVTQVIGRHEWRSWIFQLIRDALRLVSLKHRKVEFEKIMADYCYEMTSNDEHPVDDIAEGTLTTEIIFSALAGSFGKRTDRAEMQENFDTLLSSALANANELRKDARSDETLDGSLLRVFVEAVYLGLELGMQPQELEAMLVEWAQGQQR